MFLLFFCRRRRRSDGGVRDEKDRTKWIGKNGIALLYASPPNTILTKHFVMDGFMCNVMSFLLKTLRDVCLRKCIFGKTKEREREKGREGKKKDVFCMFC